MEILCRTSSRKTWESPKREIKYIVVHYTAGATSCPGEAERIASDFVKSGRDSSADYIVDDKTIVQYNPDPYNYICWHCGGNRDDTHGGCLYGLCTNNNSLGVELCSTNTSGATTFPNDPGYSFTEAVLANGAELIGYLMDTYHIDISHVVRHYDVNGKLCPGIIGWNEESGSVAAWQAFLAECKKHSELSNRKSSCTISGADIIRIMDENGIDCKSLRDFTGRVFSSISFHSDDVTPGGLFFCKGKNFRDEYLQKARAAGASGYVAEHHFDTELPGLIVPDANIAMGLISKTFYDYPQDGLVTIGVTGTNGKTTVTQFIVSILKEAYSREPGFMCTNGAHDGLMDSSMTLTTPESPVTYSFLYRTRQNGGTHFVMECSSQSEKMKRLTGLSYDIGVFTNISDDHYSPREHASFEEYLQAKLDIVRRFKKAVINKDDAHCDDALMAAKSADRILTYSLSPDTGADVYAETVHEKGLHPVFTVVTPGWKQKITVPFPGDFNISNALATCAAGYMMGISPERIATGIEKTFVHGRMFVFDQRGYSIIVDYAHNYASIHAALKAVRELYPQKDIQIIFGSAGCVGYQRRQDIVRAASEFCSRMYITTEDPGTADPEDVINEIAGYARASGADYITITDRTECVETAIENMKKSDVLFITAKGEENFIKVNGKRTYYESDVSVVWRMLNHKKGL